jgi:hypothetical protein
MYGKSEWNNKSIYISRRIILKWSIRGSLFHGKRFLSGIKQIKMELGIFMIFGGEELNKISREANRITGVYRTQLKKMP